MEIYGDAPLGFFWVLRATHQRTAECGHPILTAAHVGQLLGPLDYTNASADVLFNNLSKHHNQFSILSPQSERDMQRSGI